MKLYEIWWNTTEESEPQKGVPLMVTAEAPWWNNGKRVLGPCYYMQHTDYEKPVFVDPTGGVIGPVECRVTAWAYWPVPYSEDMPQYDPRWQGQGPDMGRPLRYLGLGTRVYRALVCRYATMIDKKDLTIADALDAWRTRKTRHVAGLSGKGWEEVETKLREYGVEL